MSRVDFVVQGASRPLSGSVPVPSDKSIAHRALLLSALAAGDSELRRFSYGGDNVSTMGVLRALGVAIDDDTAGTLRVHGVGLHGLSAPREPLDCGNSGTTMRLVAGILVAQPFDSILTGDRSLSGRPMARIASPLRRRGASIEGEFHQKKAGEITAPLQIGALRKGYALTESEEVLPIPSAQVKSALLLSGLYANGDTFVREPLVSRDHTERMLAALDVPVSGVAGMVSLDSARFSGVLPPFSLEIPGDLSAASFLIVAASCVPGSEVVVRGCGANPTRSGILDVVRDWGGHVVFDPRADAMGEPVGDLHIVSRSLFGRTIGGEATVRSIDEIPVLSVLAARAKGITVIADAAELRVKESDRLAAMATTLRAFGVSCEERPDGLVIEGRPEGPLTAAVVESGGDHRIAMSAVLLGLLANGETRVRDVDCVATSFPRFAGTLRALGADVRAVRMEEAD
jgi:3-phosphoshikimate 1-carboxyvinyltransferase